jgi:hypothetical protein
MQGAGKSLTEIRDVWPSLVADDTSLARMSGVPLTARPRAARKDFWKREAESDVAPPPRPMPVVTPVSVPVAPPAPVELRIELAPGVFVTVSVADGVSITSADVRALRAAAGPLVTELANRGLIAHVLGTLEEKP